MAARHGRSAGVAQGILVAGSALGAAGAVIFVTGGLARGAAFDLVASLVFALPAGVLFLYAGRCLQLGAFFRATIVSIVSGLLCLTEVILVGLSAGYADPCFEVAHCTRGPTFSYVALTAATLVFALAALCGLLAGPAAVGVAAWRRRGAYPIDRTA